MGPCEVRRGVPGWLQVPRVQQRLEAVVARFEARATLADASRVLAAHRAAREQTLSSPGAPRRPPPLPPQPQQPSTDQRCLSNHTRAVHRPQSSARTKQAEWRRHLQALHDPAGCSGQHMQLRLRRRSPAGPRQGAAVVSAGLARALAGALALGNFLNHGSRLGAAPGFRLRNLPKLQVPRLDARSAPPPLPPRPPHTPHTPHIYTITTISLFPAEPMFSRTAHMLIRDSYVIMRACAMVVALSFGHELSRI